MHDSSMRQLERFMAEVTEPRLVIADVGCFDDSRNYETIVKERGHTYFGIDCRSGPNVDEVVDDCYEWLTIPDTQFDVVISGQTLEHVPMPWKWIQVIYRILKPGGRVWICAPNTWEFHAVPKDCWRVWPDGMVALLEYAGFGDIRAYAEGPDTVGIGRKP